MKNADLFWRYLVERESIRRRRLDGLPREEWTSDPIMQTYSFTNVKRCHDRTTVLLCREFYDNQALLPHPSREALLNATLFRYHGTIAAARAIGWHHHWSEAIGIGVRDSIDVEHALGRKMFTGAYIVPNGGSSESKAEVVRVVANQVWDRAEWILDTDSWREASHRLTRLWGVGDFMSKEVLLDYILITGWTPVDWQTWTPVGPGAQRGAAVVKYDFIRPGLSVGESLEVCLELHAQSRGDRWPFADMPLDLTDIQFALCELAKYRKVQTGEGRPKSRFKPTIDDITSLREKARSL